MQALTQVASTSAKLSGNLVCESSRPIKKCTLKSTFSGVFSAPSDVAQKAGVKARTAVVAMSTAAQAAAGYASALIEVGKGSGNLEAIHKDVEALSSLLEDASLKGFIQNPVFSDEQKKQLISTVATESKLSPATINFLNLLVDKKRIGSLEDITAAFEELYFKETDTQVAIVTSAVKLENSQQALIAKKLQSITEAKNIKLKNIVDSSLIAGFVVKFGKDGSNEIDLSVQGQLEKLESQFNEAQPALD